MSLKNTTYIITALIIFSISTIAQNRIGGVVYRDVNQSGSLNSTDDREAAVRVALFRDVNNDQTFNSSDTLIDTEISSSNGSYEFTFNETGNFLVLVDTNDLPPGFVLTNVGVRAYSFNTIGNVVTNAHFGYDGANVGCFAFAASGDLLYVFNRFTATNKSIGTQSNGSNIQAMALSPSTNTLWAVNNVPGNNRLGRINKNNGQFSPLSLSFGTANGSKGSVILDSVFGISFDFSSGDLYAVASVIGNNVLFKIDTVTGRHVNNAFGIGNDYLEINQSGGDQENDDIAFDPTSGDLYALQQNSGLGSGGDFVIIDKESGDITVIGSPNIDNIEGLTFSRTGVFIATTGLNGPQNNSYYEIDKATGVGTLIAAF